MAGNKFLTNNAGQITEVLGVQTSAGASDANKIPALDATGRFDTSLMPVGLGADTASIVASEALSAGDFVNVWDDAGTPKVRKADASSAGKEAHGFVLSAFASAASATVYFEGSNTQLTGLVAGMKYLSVSTPGGAQAAAPTVAGQVVQRLGAAVSATTLKFESDASILLA